MKIAYKHLYKLRRRLRDNQSRKSMQRYLQDLGYNANSQEFYRLYNYLKLQRTRWQWSRVWNTEAAILASQLNVPPFYKSVTRRTVNEYTGLFSNETQALT